MILLEVKNRASSRFVEVQILLNYITSIEPKENIFETSLEVKILRGLFQVHLYSAFEKTINDIVESALIKISSYEVKNLHYTLQFNTISLMNELKSFKDCTHSKFFTKAANIFGEMSSSNVHKISETTISKSLQNIWAKTIDEIILSFGIKDFQISIAEVATIN